MHVPERFALYSEIARNGAATPWALRVAAACAGRSDRDRARAVQLAAQMLRFSPDPTGPDVVHDVAATARDGGDCEDLAICLVAAALAARLPARLVWLDPRTEHSPQAHVAAKIFVDGAWLWAEPTVRADLGEHPWTAAERLGLLRRIDG